jgi:hypothetical protein
MAALHTIMEVQSETVADGLNLLDQFRSRVRQHVRGLERRTGRESHEAGKIIAWLEGVQPYEVEMLEETLDITVDRFHERDGIGLLEAIEELQDADSELGLGLATLLDFLEECIARLSVTEVETIYSAQQDSLVLPRIIVPISQALLDNIKKTPSYLYQLTPRQFEEFVAELFHRNGFQVELTKQTRDGGKDIIAVSSRLDIPVKYIVECKRFARERKVSLEYVQRLLGVKISENANKAILVTTSQFTKDALAFANRHFWDLALKDFADLSAWIRQTSL